MWLLCVGRYLVWMIKGRFSTLLLVFLTANSAAAATDSITAAMGSKLALSSLMAQDIEAQMVELQLDIASASERKLSRYFTIALAEFYARRQYLPVWNGEGRMEQLIAALDALVDDGLNPDDYQVNQLRHALPLRQDNSAEAIPLRVADELRATNVYLRALYHLYNGKVDADGLASQWDFELQDMAPIADATGLMAAIESGQIATLFAQARPQHLTYRSFMAGLQHYRQLEAAGGWPALPSGVTLKPCAVDPQVAILRQRLRVTGEYVDPPLTDDAIPPQVQECLIANAKAAAATSSTQSSSSALIEVGALSLTSSSVSSISSAALAPSSSAASSSSASVTMDADEVFDKYLVEAVKKFQQAQYLEVDGAIGPATRAALNISVQSRIAQIRVNLDRARWLLHKIPPEMLLVDVAGFKVTYFKASQPIWQSRVQVGMAYRTSPIFKSEVNYITLNPTWTIPPTVLRKDVLPKLRKDLSYLRDNNIRVLDSSGAELDPTDIDWYKPGRVTLRQDAGPNAALGKAVIRFPNPHSVYLHDTPHQKLFNKSQRAFSSGCIRVERALELVGLLLSETPGWDSAAIANALATGKTRNVTLAKRVPILLAYWTVDAVNETEIAFKPDIYARDAGVLTALNQPL
jgi:L,D-transpeptidase YcbB